jgi:N-acetylneuraminic acid mutarotase
MKKLTSCLFLICAILFSSLAQAPNSFKYQSVIRNSSGIVLSEKNISLRISILQSSVSGTVVYSETHAATSNKYGIVNLNIGEGTVVSGNFSTIDWGSYKHFIKIEMDENGASNYTELGATELLSVPYALYAEKAGNGFSGDYNDLTNKPDLTSPKDSIFLYSDNYKFSLKVDDNGNLITTKLNSRFTKVAPIPSKTRDNSVSFVINGKGYVGMGRDSSGYFLNDLWEYNPVSNSWTSKAKFPGGNYNGCLLGTGFVVDGKAYVCFGINNASVYSNELWEYDPTSNVWTKKANFPGNGRYNAASFVIGDTAFVGTGSEGSSSSYQTDLWMYVPASNTWTQKANFPGGKRMAVTSFSVGNYGYMGGGWNGSYTSDFWKYDKNTDAWTKLNDIPGDARGYVHSFSSDNKGFAYGGSAYGGSSSAQLYKYLYEYNPLKDSWKEILLPGEADARCNTVGIMINNDAYVGIGPNSDLNILWKIEGLGN